MPDNSKQKDGIESGRDSGEPETKGRDRIWARWRRTRNQRKGSNLVAMLENSNKKKGIESERDAGEPEIKRKGSNQGALPKNPKQKEGIESRRDTI